MSSLRFGRAPHIAALVVALLLSVAGLRVQRNAAGEGVTAAGAFQRVWQRVDGPVADGETQRTWIWGPAPLAPDADEPYVEAPRGQRAVRYYDKSRMEVTQPDADASASWYVTNGLLVLDMVSGSRQIGDNAFEHRTPADINVAGDPDDQAAPTYADLQPLLSAPARADGEAISELLTGDGVVEGEPELASRGVTSAYHLRVPGIDHQVASVFWEFMNSSGPISEDGATFSGPLFESPFYATGYPITEAYWTNVRVDGVQRLVLIQAFERRVLTYTPSNPEGWQVESGNVGQHYYRWLYDSEPDHDATPTPAPATTPAPTPDSPTLVTVGAGAVDDWTRPIVRDSRDRVWIVAPDNNPAYSGSGPAELRIYRADQLGVPSSFSLVATATVQATDDGTIPFADAAIDGADRLHIVWLDHGASGQPVLYRVFDIASESWVGEATSLDDTGLAGYGGEAAQGGVSIALGSDGGARVAYSVAANQTQIRVRVQQGERWSAAAEPIRVDGAFVWHPALAAGADHSWTLAAYDATNRAILASHDAGSGWGPTQVVATGVLGPESIDQGPSLVVDADDIPTLVYLDGASNMRVSALGAGGWGDVPLGGDYFTHAPGLGLFADGTMIIAGHDHATPPNGLNAIRGHDDEWGAWSQLIAVHADGSEVFRWAGHFAAPSNIYADLLLFDEDSNDDGVLNDQTLYYVGVPAS